MAQRISIIVPTFNRSDLLQETLESILAQTRPADEIIVVDDGSTDDTPTKLKRYDGRVRVLRIENSGVCRARDAGVQLAQSQLIGFCDSDDLWAPDKLKEQIAFHEAHPEVEYSFTNFRFVEGGQWSDRTKFQEAPSDFFPEPSSDATVVLSSPLYEKLLTFQPIFPSTVVMSKAKYLRIGGFRHDFGRSPTEDFEFTLRCAAESPTGILFKPLVGIRKHEANVSGNMTRNVASDIGILKYALANHPAAAPYREKIKSEISRRSRTVAHSAYASNERQLFAEALRDVAFKDRDLKLHVKSALMLLRR